MHHNFGIFAHHAQDLPTGKRRADAISIGPGVRGDNKTLARPDFL
jgi:hypothetical protein